MLKLNTVHHGDCLELMQDIPDSSVNLILTDPPYFKVKNEAWDRQWGKPQEFLKWMDVILEQFYRILKSNGSLYCFASPRMSARVECLMAERFEVLENITWVKPDPSCSINYGAGRGGSCCKETLRSWFPRTEEIIFAEHYGSDGMAKGEAGYAIKCDKLRGFIFEPLRKYLADERDRAGMSNFMINSAWCDWKGVHSTSQTQKWFSNSCFNPPTLKAYQWLRTLFNRNGGNYLRREYEDLRREYEDLRREYEDLRRPFNVTADVPYTDVWNFKTVMGYPGKHLCEKPLDMIEHIILSSSREGDTVLDCFAGSGTTGVACKRWNPEYILIEKEAEYCEIARRRLTAEDNLFSEAEKC